jgi:hypothetical protein
VNERGYGKDANRKRDKRNDGRAYQQEALFISAGRWQGRPEYTNGSDQSTSKTL